MSGLTPNRKGSGLSKCAHCQFMRESKLKCGVRPRPPRPTTSSGNASANQIIILIPDEDDEGMETNPVVLSSDEDEGMETNPVLSSDEDDEKVLVSGGDDKDKEDKEGTEDMEDNKDKEGTEDKEHMEDKEGTEDKEDTTESSDEYLCDTCGAVYSEESEFQIHLMFNHYNMYEEKYSS